MSSDPKFVPLLLGLGIRELSVTPQAIPQVRAVIRSLTIEQAREVAERALQLDVAATVETFLNGELHKLCPEVIL
jgi:phosphotransferase system enzyme I (PtsI)